MQVQRWLVLEKTYGAKLAPFQYMQLPKKPRFCLVSPSSQSLPIRIFHKPQPWLSRTARDARPAPEAIHISRTFCVITGKGGHEKYDPGRSVGRSEAVIPPETKLSDCLSDFYCEEDDTI